MRVSEYVMSEWRLLVANMTKILKRIMTTNDYNMCRDLDLDHGGPLAGLATGLCYTCRAPSSVPVIHEW